MSDKIRLEQNINNNNSEEQSESSSGKENNSNNSQESPEAESDRNSIRKATTSKNKNLITWPDHDLLTLIDKIEENIPKNDSLSFNTRNEKLDWENIIFDDYTVEECKNMWENLQKQVRKFRLLKEIAGDVRSWVEKPQTRLRHPEMPPRPLTSAFMLFFLDKKDTVVRQNPDLPYREVQRIIGQMFRSLDAESKREYEVLSAKAKSEYEEQLKLFYNNHPEFLPKNKRSKKILNKLDEDNLGPPKKPKSPYELFFLCECKKQENLNNPNFKDTCKLNWRELPDEKKIFWINWCKEDFVKYENNMKEYIKLYPKFMPHPITLPLKKTEKEIIEKLAGKPVQPPRTAYHLFIKMLLENEEIKKLSNKDMICMFSEQWKECPDSEKTEYKIRVEQMWKSYNADLCEYLKKLSPKERDAILNKQPKRKINILKDDREMRGKKRKIFGGKSVQFNEPKRPPMTDYEYFRTVYNGNKDPEEVWKYMSRPKRLMYMDELTIKKKRYIKDFEEFLAGLDDEELEEYKRYRSVMEEENTDNESDNKNCSDSDSNSDLDSS